jgi:hypothetical protein
MSHLSCSQLLPGTAAPTAPIFHSTFSKRLAKTRNCAHALISPPSPLSHEGAHYVRSQKLPESSSAYDITSQRYKVNFESVYLNSKKLAAAPLEYKVKHKAGLKACCEGSLIWRYGVELEYLEDDESATRL